MDDLKNASPVRSIGLGPSFGVSLSAIDAIPSGAAGLNGRLREQQEAASTDNAVDTAAGCGH
jgi:hypothetical protein